MKKTRNEKRVINIPKESFDAIKKHCDKNTLDMVSWIVKNSTEKLATKISTKRITASEAKEIFRDAKVEKLPSDWLERVLKDIDEWIKWGVSGGTNNPYVNWGGTLAVTNKYGK